MLHPFQHQPLKAVYLSYEICATLFVRLPIWLLRAGPRKWRPRSSWTLKRVLFYRFLVRFLKISGRVGGLSKDSPNHFAIAPGAEVEGVWVEPVPELIVGDLKGWADVSRVLPVRLPGYWIHKEGASIEPGAAPERGEKVVYCLHGGAFVRMSAHPSDPTAAIARGLLDHVDSVRRTFSGEYRLSAGEPNIPANPFPSALIDALAGYNYLVNVVGFSPSDIVVEGDSAGGNLAHALVRYLVENQDSSDGKVLPGPPGALLLLSPWVDVGNHDVPRSSSAYTCTKTDYIGNPYIGFGVYAMKAFVGVHGLDAARNNRYISPVSASDADFKEFPRTFIVAGDAETLLDQIRILKDKMIRDLGEGDGTDREGDGKVRYYESKDAWHDHLIFTSFEPQRSDTLKEIARWLRVA